MSEARADRAHHLLDLGRYDEARTLLRALLAEDPSDGDLHGLLAQTLLGLQDYPAALEAGNRVVAAAPDDEWGHRICALVLDRMGRHAEATEAAAVAVRLAPNHWQTHQVYAQAALGVRGMGKDARAAAERAVQLGPNVASTHFTLGLVAHRLSDDQTARAAYTRTLALDPQHAMALHNLTVLDGGLRLARTAHGFGNALRLAPQESVLLENVDWLAVRFVRRLYVASVVALVIGLATSLAGAEGGAVTAWSVAVAVLLLVGCSAYTWSLARSIPTSIRRYVTGRLVRDRYLLANVVLTAIMFIVALVTCLVPGGAVIGLVALRPLGIANVALLVWTFSRR